MIKQSCELKPRTSEEDFSLTQGQGKFDSDYGRLFVQPPGLSEPFAKHLSYSFIKQPSYDEPDH